jgi:hypothetical protein
MRIACKLYSHLISLKMQCNISLSIDNWRNQECTYENMNLISQIEIENSHKSIFVTFAIPYVQCLKVPLIY